jgi:ribosomal protein S27AE
MTRLKTKVCSLCGQELDIDQFYENKNTKDGYFSQCKPCLKARQGRVEIKHRMCDECGKTFMPKNSRNRFCSIECHSANQLVGYIRIFERDEFACIYCGRSSITDGVKLHLEHIIPLSAGGKSKANNLVTSCATCNLSKGKTLFGNKTIGVLLTIVRERNSKFGICENQHIKTFRDE